MNAIEKRPEIVLPTIEEAKSMLAKMTSVSDKMRFRDLAAGVARLKGATEIGIDASEMAIWAWVSIGEHIDPIRGPGKARAPR